MSERPKHGGSLTEKESTAVATALGLDPNASNVEKVIGDGRYVQADYNHGKFEAVLLVSDLSDEGKELVAELTGEPIDE